jgi:predicted nucleotidyltransferase
MNTENIITKANEILKTNNGKVIYLTVIGSHLFGLDNPNSDIDIKGIFLPSINDTKQFKPEIIDFSTNDSGSKNTKEDLDIELISVHKFFKLLKNGDTNAYDILFSMFSTHNVLFEDREIINIFKDNYKDLISSNSKSFLSYIVSQTKKYGIKGERYNSLKYVHNLLLEFIKDKDIDLKNDNISEFFPFILEKEIKYVSLIDRSNIQRRSGGGLYLNILDKQFCDTLKFDYFLKRIESRLNSYGDRSKAASVGVDYKSLSHAYRIILQFEELIETHFIKFPLTYKETLLKIKAEDLSEFNNSYANILLELDNKVIKIQKNISNIGLYDNLNDCVLNKLFIKILSIAKH